MKLVHYVGLIAAFDLAYTQYPLYAGNYASYALHGVAAAGLLPANDWLASTTDAFPLVSAIFAAIHAIELPELAYAFHALLLGVYLASLDAIADVVFFRGDDRKRALFACVLVVLHSALFRAAIDALTGGDWAFYLQSGVAMQYLLGFVFQPSLFGVLELAAIACFLRGQDRGAGLLAAGAFAAHASYALPTAALLIAFFIARRSRALIPGFALAASVAVVQAARFGIASPTAAALLVHTRFPHHATTEVWASLEGNGSIKLAIAALAITAALGISMKRHRALFIAIGALTAVVLGLTALDVATGSDRLALLFPWRASVLLVPLGTALACAALIDRAPRPSFFAIGLAATLVVASACFGLTESVAEARARASDPALEVIRFVRATKQPGDVYAVPEDMARFRLDSGAATYVDWKSHPYRGDEVLEWWRRIGVLRVSDPCERMGVLRREGVTHVVIERGDACGYPVRFESEAYSVVALMP